MNKLESELRRLYCLPDQAWSGLNLGADNPPIDLITSTGLVRCLVISVNTDNAWSQVAALYEGIQNELDLPAPAISVSVEAGYQIWFSLAEPVALQLAQEFMGGLCRKYLAETKTAKLKLRPGTADELQHVPQIPAQHESSGRWSAFIDPSMGSMFVEETWLEMPPNLDKQASMLTSLKSIVAEDFHQASTNLRTILKAETSQPAEKFEPAQLQLTDNTTTLGVGSGFSNPKSFLLAVMNDPLATAGHRIQAATALLPFFANDDGK